MFRIYLFNLFIKYYRIYIIILQSFYTNMRKTNSLSGPQMYVYGRNVHVASDSREKGELITTNYHQKGEKACIIQYTHLYIGVLIESEYDFENTYNNL